jgi:bifunctional UDP-N-acetylglucosamine pyrophosphorylase/glucosamine-1-phosphate N-acetyltransferase
VQEQQLGTGHAFRQAVPALADFRGTVLVLCGDTPLLTTGTLTELLATHRRRGASATVLSADLDDPSGYGRVVRDAEGDIARIVEERDATPEERALHEINTAIYAFEHPEITEVLGEIRSDNRQGEYYLTDVVSLLRDRGRRVAVLKAAERRDVWELCAVGEQLLDKTYRPDGMNIGINLGRTAGAGVHGHLHVHLVPRWSGDTNFMVTVGETKVLPEDLGDSYRRLAVALTPARKRGARPTRRKA